MVTLKRVIQNAKKRPHDAGVSQAMRKLKNRRNFITRATAVLAGLAICKF